MNDGIFDFPIFDKSSCDEQQPELESSDWTDSQGPCPQTTPSPSEHDPVQEAEAPLVGEAPEPAEQVQDPLMICVQNFDSLHERIDYLTDQLTGLRNQLAQVLKSSGSGRFANGGFGFQESVNDSNVDDEFGEFSRPESEPEFTEIPVEMKDELQKLFAKFQYSQGSEGNPLESDPVSNLEMAEQLVQPDSDF